MYYTCKSCGTRVKIPEEWLVLGLNKRITCATCGKQVNLLLGKYKKEPNVTRETPQQDTVITNGDVPTMPRNSFKMTISKDGTNETLTIKEINNDNTYILGRSTKTALEYDPRAKPIIIPTDFDGAVSRIHLKLQVKTVKGNGKIIIQDLKSRNKTVLVSENGEHELNPEDQVYIEIDDKVKIGLHTVVSFSENS